MLALIGGVVLAPPAFPQTDPAPHYCDQHHGDLARVCRPGFDAVTWRLTFEGGVQVGKDEKLATICEAHDTRAGTFFGGIGFGIKL